MYRVTKFKIWNATDSIGDHQGDIDAAKKEFEEKMRSEEEKAVGEETGSGAGKDTETEQGIRWSRSRSSLVTALNSRDGNLIAKSQIATSD